MHATFSLRHALVDKSIMIYRTLLFFGLVVLISCTKDTTSGTEVQIRLANNSSVAFEDATFNGENFGDLAPNEKSEYRTFEKAYAYGAVSMTIAGEPYGWFPIDYVGEEPLSSGKYTFEYTFDEQTQRLADRLVRD